MGGFSTVFYFSIGSIRKLVCVGFFEPGYTTGLTLPVPVPTDFTVSLCQRFYSNFISLERTTKRKIFERGRGWVGNTLVRSCPQKRHVSDVSSIRACLFFYYIRLHLLTIGLTFFSTVQTNQHPPSGDW